MLKFFLGVVLVGLVVFVVCVVLIVKVWFYIGSAFHNEQDRYVDVWLEQNQLSKYKELFADKGESLSTVIPIRIHL